MPEAFLESAKSYKSHTTQFLTELQAALVALISCMVLNVLPLYDPE